MGEDEFIQWFVLFTGSPSEPSEVEQTDVMVQIDAIRRKRLSGDI